MPPFRQSHIIYLTALAASMLLAGCAAGPDFKKPAAPQVNGYTQDPLSATSGSTNVAGGQTQRFVAGQDIAGDWWTLFRCKPLNDLIERSLTNNPNITAAQAALAVARETLLAQRGAYFPAIAGSFSASRQRTSELLAPIPNANEFQYNLFTPQVSVSYVPDVFGLNRRTVESLDAQAGQQRFAWVATCITLSANVVSAAIQEASLRAQIDATHHLIDINTNLVRILRTQFDKGYASRLDVAAQESQLAQVVAALPPLIKQLAQQRDLLAALSGGFPNRASSGKFELADLQLPEELPLSLPSQLVEQRPDVRQAEENLRAASAQVGIATANRLPNFTLTADAGSMALTAGKMFTSGTGFWTLAGSVTQPLFQGGMLLHRERGAQAAYTEAAEQYRGAVVTAFQNVADTLNALEQDADALKTAAAARDAAQVTLDLSQRQWETGYVGYMALLNAQQAYNQAAIALVQTQANRFADTAALFQALGGGWWNRADLTGKDPGTAQK
jgi:NodT family efflux transporter outer membrane factor (OMF) lipoprotein